MALFGSSPACSVGCCMASEHKGKSSADSQKQWPILALVRGITKAILRGLQLGWSPTLTCRWP